MRGAFRESVLLEALRTTTRSLEVAVRASLAHSDFTPDEVDGIVRDHVVLTQARAAIALAEAA